MTNHIVKRTDGQYELELPNGRVAVSETIEPLERMLQRQEAHINEKVAFLEAWKQGVRLAGVHYFHVTSESAAQALDKEQLRPNREKIEADLGVLSHGERVFISAMYCFFDSADGQAMFARFGEGGSPGEIAYILDDKRRDIIARLLVNYTGW